jgi:hypothetical protein
MRTVGIANLFNHAFKSRDENAYFLVSIGNETVNHIKILWAVQGPAHDR